MANQRYVWTIKTKKATKLNRSTQNDFFQTQSEDNGLTFVYSTRTASKSYSQFTNQLFAISNVADTKHFYLSPFLTLLVGKSFSLFCIVKQRIVRAVFTNWENIYIPKIAVKIQNFTASL